MSWLVEGAETRDDLLALHPDLARDHHRILGAIWNSTVDPVILEYCRLRTATILGNERAWAEPRSPAAVDAGLDESVLAELAHWPRHPGFTDSARVCIGLAEQYVIDVHGITDDQVAEVERHIGPDGVVTLTTALALWEITHRFDNALLGRPPGTSDPSSEGDD